MRCLAQEKNTAIFLDEYCDEQTLTCSELEILKKLNAFRRITQAYKGHHALYIVIDASAWNNHFSSRTVDDFCSQTLEFLIDLYFQRLIKLSRKHTCIYQTKTRCTFGMVREGE